MAKPASRQSSSVSDGSDAVANARNFLTSLATDLGQLGAFASGNESSAKIFSRHQAERVGRFSDS
jgi:hypothetical protein